MADETRCGWCGSLAHASLHSTVALCDKRCNEQGVGRCQNPQDHHPFEPAPPGITYDASPEIEEDDIPF